MKKVLLTCFLISSAYAMDSTKKAYLKSCFGQCFQDFQDRYNKHFNERLKTLEQQKNKSKISLVFTDIKDLQKATLTSESLLLRLEKIHLEQCIERCLKNNLDN